MANCPKCKKEYTKYNSFQNKCVSCAIKYGKRDRKAKEKKQRAMDKVERDAQKPYKHWVKKAQTAFNSYIRMRDYGKPCISSGRPLRWHETNKVDAGHFRSVGSSPHIRFHLHNCHAQCKQQNKYEGGNADYRINLIKKIGLEKVEALENDNIGKIYSVEDLKRIARIFNKRARLAKKRRS
jgi:hypothetical protein